MGILPAVLRADLVGHGGDQADLTQHSQAYRDFASPFYGANRPGSKVSQGVLDQFWLWSMQAGLKNAYDSIKAFSETDFTEDLMWAEFDAAQRATLARDRILRQGKTFLRS
mgnify:CR=1 FL=1